MTNTEIIQAIRNEIDKRYAEYREKMKSDDFTYYEGMADALDLFEQFIDTLESERPEPYNPIYDEAYLNEKIKKATESWKGVDVDAMLAECRGYDEEKSEKPNQDELERELRKEIAYFAINGGSGDDTPTIGEIARHFAKWGADHTPLPEDTVLFQKGVAEGKRLMMEEAVEGEVYLYHSYNRDAIAILVDIPKDKLGDKVRIIVLPKED